MPQLAIFQSGNVHFAVERDCIELIEPITTALRAAQNRRRKQSIAHKGQSMLLIDLAVGLGAPVAAPHPRSAKMIVIKGRPAMALWADRIHGVVTAGADDLDALPSVFAGTARACFPKVLRRKKGLALIVDTGVLARIEASGEDRGLNRKDAMKDRRGTASGGGAIPVMQADVTVETIVDLKLHQFIGQRVKQVLAQTMTKTLARHGVHL